MSAAQHKLSVASGDGSAAPACQKAQQSRKIDLLSSAPRGAPTSALLSPAPGLLSVCLLWVHPSANSCAHLLCWELPRHPASPADSSTSTGLGKCLHPLGERGLWLRVLTAGFWLMLIFCFSHLLHTESTWVVSDNRPKCCCS